MVKKELEKIIKQINSEVRSGVTFAEVYDLDEIESLFDEIDFAIFQISRELETIND